MVASTCWCWSRPATFRPRLLMALPNNRWPISATERCCARPEAARASRREPLPAPRYFWLSGTMSWCWGEPPADPSRHAHRRRPTAAIAPAVLGWVVGRIGCCNRRRRRIRATLELIVDGILAGRRKQQVSARHEVRRNAGPPRAAGWRRGADARGRKHGLRTRKSW